MVEKDFLTTDNKYILTRLSRWISIKQAYKVNKNNSLYDFVVDDFGKTPEKEDFNKDCVFLDYFVFKNRKYAVNQFYTIGSFICPGNPHEFIDTDKEKHRVCAVDFFGDIYNPLYIEIDEFCEKVRVYELSFNKNN